MVHHLKRKNITVSDFKRHPFLELDFKDDVSEKVNLHRLPSGAVCGTDAKEGGCIS